MTSQHYYHLNRRPIIPRMPIPWPSMEKLMMSMLLGFVLGILAVVGSLKVVDWWNYRVEPAKQVLGETIMPPVNSQFNTALVDWVVKEGATDREFAQFVVTKTFEASIRRQIDPLLMLALIRVESRFNPLAVSNAGALGLTQIIPKWHTEKVNVAHVFDPEVNISVGVEILHEYTQRQHGNATKALLQYNGSLAMPGSYALKVQVKRAELIAYAMARIIKGQ